MSLLFAALDMAGKRVVVVGGGAVGARRTRALLDAGAEVVVVDPAGAAELAAAGAMVVAEPVRDHHLDGAWLVVAATDSAAVNASVADWSRQRRVWCVDASSAQASDARLPAQSRHGELAIAVASTGAADPARAARVRDRLGAAIDEAQVDLRRERTDRGSVTLVGAGPGDPGLITVAGRRALAAADVIVADRLGAEPVLAALDLATEVIDVGKAPDHHPVPQHEINAILVRLAGEGKAVVRLKGGDPFVFGRGGEEWHACVAAGVPVSAVPGITSALAGPAAAEIPVTQRGLARGVLVTTAHAGIGAPEIEAMRAGVTVVMLMGVAALSRVVDEALSGGVDPAVPVAIVEDATLPTQRVTRATLADISVFATETGVKSPATIVVGKVADAGLLASQVAATPQQGEAGSEAAGRGDDA